MRLVDANEHVWAELFEWLCETAHDLGSFRAVSRRGRDTFDVAVHSGGIPLAGHLADEPEEPGATCRWVHGWWPVCVRGCKRLKKHDTTASTTATSVVRVELPHSEGPMIAQFGWWQKWEAPAVVFCETSSSGDADPESRWQRNGNFMKRTAFNTCGPVSAAFSLRPSTSDIGSDVLSPAPFLTRVDFTGGLTHVTSIGNDFLNHASVLSDLDTRGLESVVTIGDNFGFSNAALRSCRLRGLRNVRTVGRKFLGSCKALREVDLGSLGSLAVAGDSFMDGSGCGTGTFALAGFGGSLMHIDDGCFGNVGISGELDLSGLTAAVAMGSSFCASSHVTRIAGIGGGGGGGLGHVSSIDDLCFASCNNLVTFDGRGLRSVVRIGQGFLNRCGCLTEVDLSGLARLQTIDSHFITETSRLETLDVSGWDSIEHVGIAFLSGSGVKRIHFNNASTTGKENRSASWRKVRTLPDHFLAMCSRLESVDTSAFPNITEIGSRVLRFCGSLTALDTSPWSNLTAIGDVCFEDNRRLTSVDTSGLCNVTHLGVGAFEDCEALAEFDVSNLRALAHEPRKLLHGCPLLPKRAVVCAHGSFQVPSDVQAA